MGGALHICHVFPDFQPGGAEVRTARLMNGLGDGFRHSVVSLRGNTGCAAHVDASVAVEYPTAPARQSSRMLGRMLREIAPDLVATYNWGALNAGIGAVFGKVRPWVQVLDGFTAEEAERQLFRRRVLRRFFYRRADAVVCVSRNLERMALESWKVRREKVHYLPNGIDTDHFAPNAEEDTAAIRESWGAGVFDCVIGTVSNLRPAKDPAFLLEAFARLEPTARLVFVGRPGDYERSLMERASELGVADRIRFAGEVDDTAPPLRAMDVFALSSRTEQMPLTVAEAMACGKPVVGTDVGDVRAMVAEENRAFVTARDPAAFAAALSAVAGDAELRRTLGTKNRERALDEFRLDRMVDAFRALFQRLCEPA